MQHENRATNYHLKPLHLGILASILMCSVSCGAAEMTSSLQHANVTAQNMQATFESFVQSGMHCETSAANVLCIATGAESSRSSGNIASSNTQGIVSVGYRITPNLMIGSSFKGQNTNFTVDGDRVSTNGNFSGFFIEQGNSLKQGQYARVAIARHHGQTKIDRSYPVGASSDISSGETKINQIAVNIQSGYVFIPRSTLAIMPYVGADYIKSKTKGYVESGGVQPAQFNQVTNTSLIGLVGIKGSWNVMGKAIISADIKHAQRMNISNDMITGSTAVTGDFSIPQNSAHHWNEASIGMQMTGPTRGSRVELNLGHRFAAGANMPKNSVTAIYSVGF